MEHKWPSLAADVIPLMLKKLLTKGALISLERLQLIDIQGEVLPPEQYADYPLNEPMLKSFALGVDKFLGLRMLAATGCSRANFSINYFVRGQRQYYLPKVDQENRAYQRIPFGGIDVSDQKNPLFYDAALARLNGFRAPKIPLDLLLTKLFQVAQKELKVAPFIGFNCTFYRALFLGEELTLDYANNQNELVIEAKTGLGDRVAQLCFWANKLSAEPALNHSI
jgi:hypothetical protein